MYGGLRYCGASYARYKRLYPETRATMMIETIRPLRPAFIAGALGFVLACSGAGQAASGTPGPADPADSTAAAPTVPPAEPASDVPPWLVVDSAARAVTLELEVAAKPEAQSALINGYRAGEARIIVPLGWTVQWKWHSLDASAPHSLVVMVQREKVPLEGGRAAFSNAMTRMVTEGLPAGQTDQSTFVAEEAGWYWMLCGVPGHAINGEWLELRVDPEATLPSVKISKRT